MKSDELKKAKEDVEKKSEELQKIQDEADATVEELKKKEEELRRTSVEQKKTSILSIQAVQDQMKAKDLTVSTCVFYKFFSVFLIFRYICSSSEEKVSNLL